MYKKMIVTLAALSLSAIGAAASEGQKGTELKTPLHGAAINGEKPNGSADFRTDGTRTRLTVEVEDVNLPDATVLTVIVVHNGSGSLAGTVTLAAGFGELELRSQDGDVVPPVQEGDIVLVRQGTTRRLAGVF